jgi:outer membrane protein assembly factor BamB
VTRGRLAATALGIVIAGLVAVLAFLLVAQPWEDNPVSPFPSASAVAGASPAASPHDPPQPSVSPSGTASPSPATGQGSWPMYGYDPARTRFNPNVSLRPPYRVRWRFATHQLLEFPPAIDGDLVFFTTNGGDIYGLDAETGREIWHRHYGGKFASSPTVYDGVVYLTSLNGWLFALHRDTGKGIWRYRYGSPSECSPLIWGRWVIAGCWNGSVYALDRFKHKLQWRFPTGAKVTGSPALLDDRLVFGSYDGNVYCLDYRGRLKWRHHAGRYVVGSDNFYATAALAYNTAYIGSIGGAMYALDLRTGNQRWSAGTGAYVYSSAAVWKDRVFVGSYTSRLLCFDAGSGRLRWSFPTGRPVSGSPSVIDGVVYVSSFAKRTWALDARTGKRLWAFGDGRYTPAAAGKDILYLTGSQTLYALVEKR